MFYRIITLKTTKEIWQTKRSESNRILGIVNNVRLFGTNFSNSRIFQKLLVIITERFETTISSLENINDLSTIILAELLNAL
ncbi:Retrovirus-related Pol polyprotein from transposon TNT 1-94 [Gossypium australe]|uniref:Retrovirus-related Pol polyprotein from transposon TNT 1-94 n=1 Tax=Gossypium australe TaxID=47621 RepID=A0A5B6UIG3_9ROSI|nr:Retrovirus-related Pol polyprotein from transposon TNT 1-94 [Gossypium australe]